MNNVPTAQPLLDGITHEFRAVVAANVSRPAADREQLSKNRNHVTAGKMSANLDRQALASKLIYLSLPKTSSGDESN